MIQRIAVLGGGIAGITAAMHLARTHGKSVILLEQDEELGGMQRSYHHAGRIFDNGSYVFPSYCALFDVFPELRSVYVPITPEFRRITPGLHVDRYPMSIRGHWRENSLPSLLSGFVDRTFRSLSTRREESTYDWIVKRLGTRWYESTGLRSYVHRLYHMDDRDVSVTFAERRLKELRNPSLSRMLFRRFSRTQSPLPPSFLACPPEGFSEVFRILRTALEEAGVEVHLGRPVTEIRGSKEEYRIFLGSDHFTVHRILSTVPVPVLLPLLGRIPEGRFDHVDLISLFYLGVPTFDGSVLFNFSPGGKWKRLVIHSRVYEMSVALDHCTVEITVPGYQRADPQSLRQDFENHMQSLGLFQELQFQGSCLTPRAYPVLSRHGEEARTRDRDWITSQGIYCGGRQGSHDYFSTHDTVKNVLSVADRMVTH